MKKTQVTACFRNLMHNFPESGLYFQTEKHSERRSSECGVPHTHVVHPADVGRRAGEDGGLLVGVAARGGHKAGHTVNNPLAVDAAVQGATRVTLQGSRDKLTDGKCTLFFAANSAQSGTSLGKNLNLCDFVPFKCEPVSSQVTYAPADAASNPTSCRISFLMGRGSAPRLSGRRSISLCHGKDGTQF